MSEVATAGYTEVEGIGLGAVTDDGRGSITVEILTLDPENKITINYGNSVGQGSRLPHSGQELV